jgi:Rrf2 family cysteine metabolism transcriptional repressor
MALLNRKVDYAILVLADLHQHAGGASARELAQRLGLSRAFLANILKELCHKGFVSSHRGVKGGYAISSDAATANLADFIEALDDTFRLAECNGGEPHDGCTVFERCPVRGPIAAVHGRIREVLRQVTLGELFRAPPVPAGYHLTVLDAPVGAAVAS